MLKLELLTTHDDSSNGMTVCLKPRIKAVITPGLVEEIRRLQNSLAERYLSNKLRDNFYVIWHLENREGLCYRGLDFDFILNCIKNDKNTQLEDYIEGIYNLIFLNHIGLGFPIINCSIVSRTLSGLSREFFFINKLCFIHNDRETGIRETTITNGKNQLLLNKDIYNKNRYFYFDFIRTEKMRDIIQETNSSPLDQDEIISLKNQFENLKKSTLSRLYASAAQNLKTIERMAAADHRLSE